MTETAKIMKQLQKLIPQLADMLAKADNEFDEYRLKGAHSCLRTAHELLREDAIEIKFELSSFIEFQSDKGSGQLPLIETPASKQTSHP